MKRIFLVLILLAFMPFTSVLRAQAPQAVTLQSVLRDAAGRLIANRNVSVLISLRRGSNTGPVVYSETHTPTTNQNGLYTVFFGRGFTVTGTFASIDWSQGPYYATVEADPTGGSNYTLTVSHPIVSVPYALFADTAAHAPTAGNAVHAVYADTAYYYKEEQTIRISHDTIYLSGGRDNPTGGSFVKLPHDSILMALDSIINHPCRTKVGEETRSVCDSYTWPANGETYTTSGVKRADFPRGAADGCDSIAFLYLTIRHTTNMKTTEFVANYYYWAKHNKTYSLTGEYSVDYTNSEGCASRDSLILKVGSQGSLSGVFTVNSAGKRVRFSMGNLQYKASIGLWRFALHQYDFVGGTYSSVAYGNVYNEGVSGTKSTHNSIAANYGGWIDLFGWGTSGWKSDVYNTRYLPYMYENTDVNTTYNKYGYGPSTNVGTGDLTGVNERSDWGRYVYIENGGGSDGRWRTLTKDEWTYIIKNTSRTSTRFIHAKVNDVIGLVLFPDGYFHDPSLPPLASINTVAASHTSNTFDLIQWNTMERAGAVFLPAASYRYSTTYYTYSTSYYYGYYWSSTHIDKSSAYRLRFDSYCSSPDSCNPEHSGLRYYGCSVRLVQDLE